MKAWTDHITKSTIETVEALKDALFTMDIILSDPLVTSQFGYAYTGDDMDVLEAGKEALSRWVPNPQGIVQRQVNATLLDQGGYAVSRAEMMLRRQGFDDVRSAGNSTLEGDAFHDDQKRVVENAWNRYQAITQHQRG